MKKRYTTSKECDIWWVRDNGTGNSVAMFVGKNARRYAIEHANKLSEGVR